MAEVWKFDVTNNILLQMPRGCKILSAGVQRNEIKIWALVNSHADKVPRRASVFPTGFKLSPAEQDYEFIDTVSFLDGGLIFHVFVEKEI